MKTLNLLYHIARADFLERVRRYSFLVTVLVTIAVTYFFLPALDAPLYAIVDMRPYRPIYNSAWIALVVVLLMAEFFPLFGFYLVKNTIERDRNTRVGEIIATTPLSKPMYTLGKWLSNVAVFVALTIAMILASLVLQLIRAEDLRVDVWALVAPFLFVLLPELAFIAALAVLFESINWLRGGFGNLIYYLVYAFCIITGDLQGISSVWPSVYRACAGQFPACPAARRIEINGVSLVNLPTFRFEGVVWTPDNLLPRLGWVIASLTVALIAAYFFHRFDPSRLGRTLFAGSFERMWSFVLGFVLEHDHDEEDVGASAVEGVRESIIHLRPLDDGSRTQGILDLYGHMFVAEARLTFKGIAWWWYPIAALIIAFTLLAPIELARLIVLPLACVWPVLIWSNMGVREVQHYTAPFIFALPYALRRQLLITWLIGWFVAVVMGSGAMLRLAWAGDWASLVAVLIGTLFIPSFALALGCWSGSGKLFQAIYLFLWYMATVQGVIWLDFMGHIPATVALGVPWLIAALTVGLIAASIAGRRHQLLQ